MVTNGLGNSVSLWNASDLTPIGTYSTGANPGPFGVCSDRLNFWITFPDAGKLARFEFRPGKRDEVANECAITPINVGETTVKQKLIFTSERAPVGVDAACGLCACHTSVEIRWNSIDCRSPSEAISAKPESLWGCIRKGCCI